MSWFNRLKSGLSKSSAKITNGIDSIFTKRKLDNEMLEELEELLITADLGTVASARIVDKFSNNRFNKEISSEEVFEAVASEIAKILKPVAIPLIADPSVTPYVIMMVGVNGNGKTTTLGKIAKQFKQDGKTVMIAACDTFRAAAVEQLVVWGERSGCPVITGAEGADPASVAYTAFMKASEEKADILLIDTAGRLQNKKGLMEELAKISRVIKKNDTTAPHSTILVLDATTGQNAHSQVKIFREMSNITGIIVTKLDGTAKGGVVVALAEQFGLPVHAIGVGEGVDDLHHFSAEDFAKNLFQGTAP